MLRRYSLSAGLIVIAFGVGFLFGRGPQVAAQAKNRVFEIRTATAPTRQTLDVLLKRFREGEVRMFENAGMEGIGFWLPVDPPNSENTLIYILAHESLERAQESWASFSADPEFRALTERIPAPPVPEDPTGRSGGMTVERIFAEPVDFSPIK